MMGKIDAEYSAREVADRLAIAEQINRYVWALDDHQYDLMDDVFLPECRFDMTSAGGIKGTWKADVKAYFDENLRAFENYIHTFTNVQITFGEDGDTAVSRSKVLNPCGLRIDGKLRHFETTGEYRDNWVRTPEGWRVQERTFVLSHIWGDYPFETLPGEFDERA